MKIDVAGVKISQTYKNEIIILDAKNSVLIAFKNADSTILFYGFGK